MFSIFKKKTVVPHVRLTGIIGSAGRFKQGMELANQKDILKKAFSVKKITHVAISINSPGGSPVQSHLIYSYIRELAKTKKVKVIIFAEDVAASGGYFIACAGDEIFANSSSIIGSIRSFQHHLVLRFNSKNWRSKKSLYSWKKQEHIGSFC